MPIPVAEPYKAWVCGCSLVGVVVSNPVGAWVSVCHECCVLPGRGLCVGMITPPEESYRVYVYVCMCVYVCVCVCVCVCGQVQQQSSSPTMIQLKSSD